MPPLETHLKWSKERTGNEFREVHEWLDGDPEKAAERHDITRLHGYALVIEKKYGSKGREEYICHIRDDVRAKFRGIHGDYEEKITEALAYFGFAERGASCQIKTSDMEILRAAGVSEDDIAHCVKVAEKALEIAGRTGAEVDMELVCRGALFHDLGKAETHEIEHGKIGAEMGARLGLPVAITDIMEKHVRGGMTEPEAAQLGLPVKDYTLGRLEERIVIYADRLVDIITEDIVDIGDEIEAEQQFEEILSSYPRYGKGDLTMNRYFVYHAEIQGLMKKGA